MIVMKRKLWKTRLYTSCFFVNLSIVSSWQSSMDSYQMFSACFINIWRDLPLEVFDFFACLFYFVLFYFVEPGIFLQFHQNRPRFIHRDWRHEIHRRTEAIAELAFVTLETLSFEKTPETDQRLTYWPKEGTPALFARRGSQTDVVKTSGRGPSSS